MSGCTTAGTCSASPATDRRPTMLTARTFLVRGLLAGLAAGILAFGVAYLVGEPPVAAAIALEDQGAVEAVEAVQPDDHPDHAADAGHTHGDGDDAIVSRQNQA